MNKEYIITLSKNYSKEDNELEIVEGSDEYNKIMKLYDEVAKEYGLKKWTMVFNTNFAGDYFRKLYKRIATEFDGIMAESFLRIAGPLTEKPSEEEMEKAILKWQQICFRAISKRWCAHLIKISDKNISELENQFLESLDEKQRSLYREGKLSEAFLEKNKPYQKYKKRLDEKERTTSILFVNDVLKKWAKEVGLSYPIVEIKERKSL